MSIDIPHVATEPSREYLPPTSIDLLRQEVCSLANIKGRTPDIDKEGLYTIGEDLLLQATIIDSSEAFRAVLDIELGVHFGRYFELAVQDSRGDIVDYFSMFENGGNMTFALIDGEKTFISDMSDEEIERIAANFRKTYLNGRADWRKGI